MSFEPHERHEIDRLWNEHNAQVAIVSEQQTRLRLLEERLSSMSTEAAKSSGAVGKQLDQLAQNVKALSNSILTFEVQQSTRGGLLDRWLPLCISGVCALAVVKDIVA